MATLWIDDDGSGSIGVERLRLHFRLDPTIDASADLEGVLPASKVVEAVRASHAALASRSLELEGVPDGRIEGWVGAFDTEVVKPSEVFAPELGTQTSAYVFLTARPVRGTVVSAIVQASFSKRPLTLSGLPDGARASVRVTDFTAAPFADSALTLLCLRPVKTDDPTGAQGTP